MKLDDPALFRQIDTQDYLSEIDRLPDQLLHAYELGGQMDLPDWQGFRQVVIAGMGGSAIGADLLVSWAAQVSQTPISLHRDYDLPAWAVGQGTLVVCSSHSGNTEETLSAFQQAVARGCRCLVICTGGELARLGQQAGVPAWQFVHQGQPRAAVGFSFGLLAAALSRLGILPEMRHEIDAAVQAMRQQQFSLKAYIPAVSNQAKRIAGQMMGRWVVVMGSGVLAPVALRWKGQISELAKAWAQSEAIPEADHNTLAGVQQPEGQLPGTYIVFLQGAADHPRNRLRSDLTRKVFMLEGLATDYVNAQGSTPLAQQWTCLHYGDYVAYYLAMGYGIDPTPIPAIASLKREMSASNP